MFAALAGRPSSCDRHQRGHNRARRQNSSEVWPKAAGFHHAGAGGGRFNGSVFNHHASRSEPMRKYIVVLMAGSLLATTGWTAEKNGAPKKEESIGVGTGAAIGAIAGGPVGLILGAAFGGWIGDRFHKERVARTASEQEADEAHARASSLEHELRGTERELTTTRAQLSNERVAHRSELEQALAVEVYFRTEESALDGSTEQRLADLAGLVAPMDDTVIRLAGHTDARGTELYNAELSTARATSVRDALIRAGMPAERIVVTAAGESESAAGEQDIDGMALERRVEVKIIGLGDASQVAQQRVQ
jgi:outer membrane protein OmpA-like peptidoglycan-associated protein